MSTTTEAQVKQIVGSCEEISEKNGWTSFSIDVGSQYPIRLSTKLPALIEQARTVGDARSTWTYKEQQSEKLNENTGKPFVNRYLEGVQIGGDSTAGTVQIGTNATGAIPHTPSEWTQKPNVDWDAKERRDYRSRAWAQTLGAFTHTISVNDKPEDVFARLQPFQRKIFNDVCQSFAYPADDSDIPFGS